MFPHGETIVRLRGAEQTDRYGGKTWDWTSPAELPIPGCAVAPRESSEATDAGRQGVIVGLTVYVPAASDIVASDRLRIRGEEHEVEGEVGEWRSPFTGWEPGLEVNTRRVTG